MDYIDEVYKQSLDMAALQQQLYPDDDSPGLPASTERTKVSSDKTASLKWHTDQLSESKLFFAGKLGLKRT